MRIDQTFLAESFMRLTSIALLFLAVLIQGIQNIATLPEEIVHYLALRNLWSAVYVFLLASTFLFLMILPIASYILTPRLIDRSLDKFKKIPDDDVMRLVERLATKVGIKPPEVMIIKTELPNCFIYACGLKQTRIVLTSGLVEDLSDEELSSVILHELSHALNKDVILMTWGITMVKALKLWSLAFLSVSFIFSILSDNPLGFLRGTFSIQFVILILWTLLFPLLTILSISRVREHLADMRASLLTGAKGLLTALAKINLKLASCPSDFPSFLEPLMISPTKLQKGLFSSHPTLKKRAEFLNANKFLKYRGNKILAFYSGLSASFVYYSFTSFIWTFTNINLTNFLGYIPIVLSGTFLGCLNCIIAKSDFSLRRVSVLNFIGSLVSSFLFLGPLLIITTSIYYIYDFDLLTIELGWQLFLLLFVFLIQLGSSSFVSLVADDLLRLKGGVRSKG